MIRRGFLGRLVGGLAAALFAQPTKADPPKEHTSNELWFEGHEPDGGIDPHREVLKVRIVWRHYKSRMVLAEDDSNLYGLETTGYVYAEPLEKRRKFAVPVYQPQPQNWAVIDESCDPMPGVSRNSQPRQAWLRLQTDQAVFWDLDGPGSPIYVEDA